jgi:hypothetical protein
VATLSATRPSWLILQSRDEASREIIEASLREHAGLDRPHEPRICGDDPLWQFAIGWKIALLREDTEKAGFFRGKLAERLKIAAADDMSLAGAVIGQAQRVYSARQSKALGQILDSG